MPFLLEGKYWDVVQKADGRRVDWGWRPNLVVEQCRDLLAAFMLGGSALGIQHLDLGRGASIWDNTPPAPPSPGDTALTDPSPVVIPTAGLQLDYLDAVGDVTTIPHHRIQITLTLTPGMLPISGDEIFPLREFALFGQLNGSDYMIDYVRHPVMNLAADDTLTRRIRLVF